eukprot:RCo027108
MPGKFLFLLLLFGGLSQPDWLGDLLGCSPKSVPMPPPPLIISESLVVQSFSAFYDVHPVLWYATVFSAATVLFTGDLCPLRCWRPLPGCWPAAGERARLSGRSNALICRVVLNIVVCTKTSQLSGVYVPG